MPFNKTIGKIAVLAYLFAGMAVPLCADEETALPAWGKEDIADVEARLAKRAGQGDAETQNRLGKMYYYGDGVSKNLKRAVHWFDRSAEQGYAAGQFNLARLYREGKGVEQSYERAAHWYRKAAEQGLVIAQFFLGKSYAEGQGVPKDPIQAYYWLHRAAAQGDGDAQWARDRLVKSMSPEQLTEARTGEITIPPKIHGPGSAEEDSPPGGGAESRPVPPPQPVPVVAADHAPKAEPKATPKKKEVSLSRKDIRALQGKLRTLGLEPGPLDGIAGPKTRAALKKFQARAGLEPDGRISQELVEALHVAPENKPR